MKAALWEGSPVQAWLSENWKHPAFRQAYFIGMIETTAQDFFGPDLDDHAPPEAREFAAALFDALTSRNAAAADRVAEIVALFRAKAN